jgi:hypothetical protein
MIITPKGLLQSVEVLTSCMYIHGKNINDEQRKIISAAIAKENTSLNDFLAAFPIEMDTGKAIASFSQILGKGKIDEEVVQLFFGGLPHIDYALKEIELNGPPVQIIDTFLIFHVGLPVVITDVYGSISGKYENDKIKIRVKNIVNLADKFNLFRDINLEVGKKVLIHYGAIVSTTINEENWDTILAFQKKNPIFKRACENTKIIDCEKFVEITRRIYKSI